MRTLDKPSMLGRAGARQHKSSICVAPMCSSRRLDVHRLTAATHQSTTKATITHASEGMSPTTTSWTETFGAGTLIPPKLSKTDEEFASLSIEFVDKRQGMVLSDLNDLFERVGFPRRDPERMRVALENSHSVLWVRCTKSSRYAREGQLLGFARATSDRVLSATIWDVAVHPGWQRNGIGRGLMERLVTGLVRDGIPLITLYAEPKVVNMYQKLGFMPDPEGIKGMAFQRKKKESAAVSTRR